jgi:hypothetical protein
MHIAMSGQTSANGMAHVAARQHVDKPTKSVDPVQVTTGGAAKYGIIEGKMKGLLGPLPSKVRCCGCNTSPIKLFGDLDMAVHE